LSQILFDIYKVPRSIKVDVTSQTEIVVQP